jgi:hypothetical protein
LFLSANVVLYILQDLDNSSHENKRSQFNSFLVCNLLPERTNT